MKKMRTFRLVSFEKPSKRTPFYLLGGRVKIILKIFKMSFKDRIFKIVIIIIA